MPTISLTLPTAGTVITAGLHSANYSSLQTLLNGGLDTSNWASGKIFAPSKLTQEAATDKQFLGWSNSGSQWQAMGDWTAYTPTWTATTTNPVIGNGTLAGRYTQIGKLVIFTVDMTAGTTTTFGTGAVYTFSLPVTAGSGNLRSIGTARGQDVGATDYSGLVVLASTTGINILNAATSAAAWGPTVPFTWGNTDFIRFTGTYEAA